MPKVLILSAADLAPELGRTILWSLDVERVLASTPAAALDVARSFVPSLVVVDGADGAAACSSIRRLRENPGTRRASIVALARSPSPAQEDLLVSGANLVLEGPVDPAVWDAQLEKLLSVPRRLKMRFPVRFVPRGPGPAGDEPTPAVALDLSLGGMLLETDHPIPAGTALDVRFALPEGGEEVGGAGTVVRASSGVPAQVGIRFLTLEGAAQDRIRALLTSAAPERTFGRYEVLGLIGEGSMGRVFRAFDPLARHVVAIKTLRPEHLAGPEAEDYLRRFQREAQAAARLVHPNIITIFDVSQDYFVMELLDGTTLQAILRDRGSLALDELCRILGPVSEALDYAHSSGTVHRDIKPANIMVLADGRPKIMDFGVAHLTSAVITASGEFFGSPAYVAPEQITRSEVTGATDLFSLAVVAYEGLTGRRPFEGDSITPILYRVVNTEPAPPSTWSPDLPPACDGVLRRALAKDPGARFPNATTFLAALSGRVAAADIPAAAPVTPTARGAHKLDDVDTHDLTGPPTEALTDADRAMAVGASARLLPLRPRAPLLLGMLVLSIALGAAVVHRSRRGTPGPEAPPRTAAVEISSDPVGARISLDGVEAGMSPLTVSTLRPGPHLIRVSLEGFSSAELAVDLPTGTIGVPLRFTLQPVSAILQIRSEPAGAAVRIDGHASGTTPIEALSLPPGSHQVELTQKGFSAYRVSSEPYNRSYEVGPWRVARPRSVWKAAIGVRRRLKRKVNSSR